METSLDNIGSVRLKGVLGARLDAMIERNVAAKDIDEMTAPFLDKTETRRLWQTEFWGKWMHSAVPFLVYSGNAALRGKIVRGVERILASQEENGYIGNYPDALRFGEGWDVWGIKYTMMGLMHWHDAVAFSEASLRKGGGPQGRGENPGPSASRILESAKRLCDCLVAELGPGGRRGRELWQTGNWAGCASSSVLEPVVWLYRRTGERRYLDFAGTVVRGMVEPEAGPRLVDLALRGVHAADRDGYGNNPDDNGEYVCKDSRTKAYETMSCYQGLLEYCEAVGGFEDSPLEEMRPSGRVSPTRLKAASPATADLFRAALLTAEDIAAEEINLAGGGACIERWFHGARKQGFPHARLQETCVTVTWMRLCQKLLRMTGDPKWADLVERAFYNAYLASIKPDGSEFASYTPLSGSRWHGMRQCFMHEDCCDANGPRGFLCFLQEFFRAEGDTATLNFYASARAEDVLPATGRRVAFDVYTLYPREETVRIACLCDGTFTLRLRIPGWCSGACVRVNGEALPAPEPGAYCAIAREWRAGDVVELALPMPVVAHVADHYAAFTRGPVLLARDSRFGDGDLSEPLYTDPRYGGGIADGEIRPFAPVRIPSDAMWMAFGATLPIGQHYANPEGTNPPFVSFCDFASAGNEWNRSHSYRTWLPIERSHAE